MSNAYHQVRLEDDSVQYNAINTGDLGSYHIRVMLQGDTNAPATMMRVMNTILAEYIGKFVWVYLDDIMIFSQSYDDHMRHLSLVFKKLSENKFFLKMNKCQLLVPQLKLLGHIIEGNKIRPHPEKIRKILDWKEPTNKKDLLMFLGVVNYISPHLPHYATISSPLTELTGNVDWRWDTLHQTTFDTIKRACENSISTTPINYQDVAERKEKVFLITDVSRVGVGAFLCHGPDLESAKKNIAALHSRKFNNAQQNYHTTDQELLAIIDALQTFESKLLGIKFTIVTDHKALEYVQNRTIHNARIVRWMDFIQRFNFNILHTPGRKNILADALS